MGMDLEDCGSRATIPFLYNMRYHCLRPVVFLSKPFKILLHVSAQLLDHDPSNELGLLLMLEAGRKDSMLPLLRDLYERNPKREGNPRFHV